MPTRKTKPVPDDIYKLAAEYPTTTALMAVLPLPEIKATALLNGELLYATQSDIVHMRYCLTRAAEYSYNARLRLVMKTRYAKELFVDKIRTIAKLLVDIPWLTFPSHHLEMYRRSDIFKPIFAFIDAAYLAKKNMIQLHKAKRGYYDETLFAGTGFLEKFYKKQTKSKQDKLTEGTVDPLTQKSSCGHADEQHGGRSNNMKIIKRDGTTVAFKSSKIKDAVLAALTAVDMPSEELAKTITEDVVVACTDKNNLTVEIVQDLVETALMKRGLIAAAKSYIKYRYLHQQARDRYKDLMTAVDDKLSAKKVVNQNANVDERSFGGRIGEAGSVVMKEVAQTSKLSDKAKRNHQENRIYIHDLDHYAVGDHNCLTIPFDDLLKTGFEVKQGDVRPPQSVGTALQLVAVVFQVQSLNQFGGVSASHLDWTMVPYVRKSFYSHFLTGAKYIAGREEKDVLDVFKRLDRPITPESPIDDANYGCIEGSDSMVIKYAMDMTVREIEQAAEALLHNLNTLQSRSGNQLPFTSINYGTCTLPEGRLITEKLLEATMKGIGKRHRTSIFPCQIFQKMKGVNDKGSPNYDLYLKALEVSAYRVYPNYANCDWSGNAGYDKNDPRTYFSTMGCRTANGFDINGFGQLKDGRGNICPVTIILPTLAMEANGNFARFMELLKNAISDAKDMLIERFDWICSQSADSAKFMYENHTMAGYVPEEGIRSALKHGTLAIGQLGLAEALQILIGKDHTSDEGMALAKQIESMFKKMCAEYKEKYKLNFGVYFTPAENLCHTALLKFREKYGVIPNVSDKEFFTNSMHVPVWKNMSALDKIKIEAQLTGYSSAGCMTYVELDGSCKNNIEAMESLVDYAMDMDIPYLGFNTPNDQCQKCGYIGDIPDTCPKCGSDDVLRLRRVTGYLSTDYHNFNQGKQDETVRRVKHNG